MGGHTRWSSAMGYSTRHRPRLLSRRPARTASQNTRPLDPAMAEPYVPKERIEASKQRAHTSTVKHVNRLVTSYLRDSSGSIENPAGSRAPDLKAIATDASARDTVMVCFRHIAPRKDQSTKTPPNSCSRRCFVPPCIRPSRIREWVA